MHFCFARSGGVHQQLGTLYVVCTSLVVPLALVPRVVTLNKSTFWQTVSGRPPVSNPVPSGWLSAPYFSIR
jgi:hypothetical protein